jgi:hypothetical protein
MSSPVLPRQYEPLRAAAYKRGFAEGKASALGVAGKIGLTPIESSSTGHVLATTVYLQPDHTITGRAFEIGPLEVRKRIVAKFTATEAAKRHETLVRQIAVAQQKITASEDVLRRVQAARELLEGNPVEDFAAKLREVEGQAAAATTALAAAKLDHNALTGQGRGNRQASRSGAGSVLHDLRRARIRGRAVPDGAQPNR